MNHRVLIALTVTAATLAAARADDKPKGDNYAFLVGCANYDAKELRPLKFAVEDVAAFAELLKQSGWAADHVILMNDNQERSLQPECKKVREELEKLLSKLGPDDAVIVALSGHGVQFQGDKTSYFCPVDARLDDKETLLPLNWVYERLDKCKAARKLLLVDACRNDPLSEVGKKGPEGVKLENTPQPQAEAVPKGIAALFSCSEGQASYEDPELKHGVFFHHVLRGWQGDANAEGPVTLDDLVRYVRKETAAYARTNLGALQAPALKGELSGQWLLADHPKPGETRNQAIEAIRQMGGQLEILENHPGRPVVHIDFLEAKPKVTDADPVKLRPFDRLEWLGLYGQSVTDEGMTEVAKLPRLKTLFLSGTKVTGAGLKRLAPLKNLESLVIGGDGTKWTAKDLQELAPLEKLQWLDLDDASVSGEALQELAALKHLRKLDLNGCKFKDADLAGLAGLTSLEELELGNTAVKDEGLKEVAKLEGLRSLNLISDDVTDEGMSYLAGLKHLESLELSFTPVTDEGLKHLAGLPQLESLSLGNTRVTNAGLRHLTRSKQLRALFLFGSPGVTDDGIAELKHALPDLNVTK